MKKIEKPIHIVGLSIVTTNEKAMTENSIGLLWDLFLKSALKEKLSGLVSDHVFAVYSDYENQYHGHYKITIGYALHHLQNVPEELAQVTIPSGNYQVFPVEKQTPEAIIATWQTIWNGDPNSLPRNYIADFEEYSGHGVNINIGCH